jgi:Cu2+-exporting ATPase
MEQYNVTGMSCAACQARVEKAVSRVPGVTSCNVSLLTNSMAVDGTAVPDAIIKAVQQAGYGASKKGTNAGEGNQMDGAQNDADALADHETPVLLKRLCGISSGTDVLFDGTYDVWLAAATLV